MRIMIMFDLPIDSDREKREYTKFRRYLIKEGFIMMQKSVYTKLAINQTTTTLIRNRLEKNLPQYGLVQVLVITEKQFASIHNMVGCIFHSEMDSTERLILL